MKVYVFGNKDLPEDSKAVAVAESIGKSNPGVDFVFVKPNEDLPFVDEDEVIIMDTVEGIGEVKLLGAEEIDRLILSPRTSVHDFDLGFQLKYLRKLGKLTKVGIVGIPMTGKIDHKRINSIFKKLVAQDMQGS